MGTFTGELWPIHPHRLPDELLSFWIMRVAHANRVKLQTFTNLTFGRFASPWARDIDRSAPDAFLEKLSQRTGASLTELRSGMLPSYEGIVFEHHNANGNTPWVLPLGIYHRTRKAYGMQFCPECLFWDKTPYFRRRWRLAFATLCDRHGIMLHDRCPECSAPVIYFRNDLGHRKDGMLGNHILCWKCGFDLRCSAHLATDWIDAESTIALRSLLTFFDSGLAVAGHQFHQYAPLFFPVLHRICAILNSPSPRFRRLLLIMEAETGNDLSAANSHRGFEQLGIKERHSIVLAALWLLTDWPGRFVRICRAAKLSRSLILGDIGAVPYWFDRLLRTNLNESKYILTAEEAHHGAEFLARSGASLSKNSLQRLLGHTSEKTTAPYRQKRVSSFQRTAEEFDRLLARLEEKIRSLSPHTLRRKIAERDKYILLTMKETGWKASKVLKLTLQEIRPLLSPSNTEISHALRGHLLWYIRTARTVLTARHPSNALFVGTQRPYICIENLANRIRTLDAKRPYPASPNEGSNRN